MKKKPSPTIRRKLQNSGETARHRVQAACVISRVGGVHDVRADLLEQQRVAEILGVLRRDGSRCVGIVAIGA